MARQLKSMDGNNAEVVTLLAQRGNVAETRTRLET